MDGILRVVDMAIVNAPIKLGYSDKESFQIHYDSFIFEPISWVFFSCR